MFLACNAKYYKPFETNAPRRGALWFRFRKPMRLSLYAKLQIYSGRFFTIEFMHAMGLSSQERRVGRGAVTRNAQLKRRREKCINSKHIWLLFYSLERF
jgi:hypothetical protein